MNTAGVSVQREFQNTGVLNNRAHTYGEVRNPGSDASNRYGPIGRFGKTKDPVSFVIASRVIPCPSALP